LKKGDKAMERLTSRTENGNVLACCIGCEFVNDCSSPCDDYFKAVDKFAEYEIAEAQGLLIKLPCKVGDVVFTICKITGANYYYVTDIRCDRQHGWYALLGFNTLYRLSEFGKTVFITREAAEEALKGSVSE
jgi:hypothetical protein